MSVLRKKGVTSGKEKVAVYNDFVITLPENFEFSTIKSDIHENRFLSAIKKTENEYFLEENDSEYSLDEPFAAPVSITVNTSFVDLAQIAGGLLNFEIPDVRSMVIKIIDENYAQNPIFSLLTGGADLFVVKETDTVITAYCKGERHNFFFFVATPAHIHNGQIFVNDIEPATEEIWEYVEEILDSIEAMTVSDDEDDMSSSSGGGREIRELTPFTFENDRRITVFDLSFPIPDNARTPHEELEGEELFALQQVLSRLTDEYAYLAVDKDHEDGFDDFRDAEFSISIKASGIEDGVSIEWDDCESNIQELINNNLSVESIEVVRSGEKLASAICLIRLNEDDCEPWAQYFVDVFHKERSYQVNIYINAKLDTTLFEENIKEWVGLIRPASASDGKKYAENSTRKALGKLIGANGKIDAVMVSLLFSKDIVFFNEDEVGFDGEHHVLNGMQFNAEVIDDYPDIKKNIKEIGKQITDVVTFAENNENLIIPLERVHENVLAAAHYSPHKEPLTGISVFFMCAWHVVTIAEVSENEYTVAVDRNLASGIPECGKYLAEFIRTLREFNGITEAFDVKFFYPLVVDSPIEYISKPVHGACEDIDVYVEEGECPFNSEIRDTAAENRIQVSKLQYGLIKYFIEKNTLIPLADICKDFPSHSKSELKSALDEMIDMGIFVGGDKIIMCMYSLYSEDVDIDDFTADSVTPEPKKKSSDSKKAEKSTGESARKSNKTSASSKKKTAEEKTENSVKKEQEDIKKEKERVYSNAKVDVGELMLKRYDIKSDFDESNERIREIYDPITSESMFERFKDRLRKSQDEYLEKYEDLLSKLDKTGDKYFGKFNDYRIAEKVLSSMLEIKEEAESLSININCNGDLVGTETLNVKIHSNSQRLIDKWQSINDNSPLKQISAIKSDISKLEKEISDIRKDSSDAKAEEARRQYEKAKTDAENEEKRIAKFYDKEIADRQNEIGELQKELDKCNSEHKALSDELASLSSAHFIKRSELKKKCDANRETAKKYERNIEIARETLADLENNKSREKKRASEELKSAEDKFKRSENERNEAPAKIRSKEKKLEELENKLRELEEQ